MKRMTCLLAFVLFFAAFAAAQNLAAIDTGKYRINLPDYWRPGNKIWQVLTDKLPIVCEELVDKELCGDRCNPRYSIEFEMSEPDIIDYYANRSSIGKTTDTWEIVTLYRFSSSLLLFNEKDELLTRLILVGKDETWRVTERVELRSYVPSKPQRIYVAPVGGQSNADLGNQQFSTPIPGQSPYSYIDKNKEKLSPTRRDMLGIIDEKIRSW